MSVCIHQSKQVVDFLKDEVKKSSNLLHHFIHDIGVEISAFTESDHANTFNDNIFRITEILQCEDRIQQRLGDIIMSLDAIKKILISDDNNALNLLYEDLILEEMKYAFAKKANINDLPEIHQPVKPPSIGEVDLF